MNRIEGPDWGVSHEVELTIRKQARGFAARAGRLDVAEDLAQEGRIEAWKTASSGETESRHLLADSKEGIRDCLRLGSSVHGKLWATYKRPKVYGAVSLEQEVGDGDILLEEVLVSEHLSVEDQALGNVTLWEVWKLLTDDERRVLWAKLQGQSYAEIVEQDEDMTRHQVKKRIKGIREKVARYLDREDLL